MVTHWKYFLWVQYVFSSQENVRDVLSIKYCVIIYFPFGHLYSAVLRISYYFLSSFFCSCVTSSSSTSSPTATTPSRSWVITLAAWPASLRLRRTVLWENTSLINTLCKGHSSTVTQAPHCRNICSQEGNSPSHCAFFSVKKIGKSVTTNFVLVPVAQGKFSAK